MFVQASSGGGWPPFYQFGGGGHTIIIGRQPGGGGVTLPNLPIGLSREHAPLAWEAATYALQWSNTSSSGQVTARRMGGFVTLAPGGSTPALAGGHVALGGTGVKTAPPAPGGLGGGVQDGIGQGTAAAAAPAMQRTGGATLLFGEAEGGGAAEGGEDGDDDASEDDDAASVDIGGPPAAQAVFYLSTTLVIP